MRECLSCCPVACLRRVVYRGSNNPSASSCCVQTRSCQAQPYCALINWSIDWSSVSPLCSRWRHHWSRFPDSEIKRQSLEFSAHQVMVCPHFGMIRWPTVIIVNTAENAGSDPIQQEDLYHCQPPRSEDVLVSCCLYSQSTGHSPPPPQPPVFLQVLSR